MIGFLADEDFSNHIVQGVLAQIQELDLATVKESGLSGAPDCRVLQFAADHDLIVLTHDVNTMIAEAIRRVRAGQQMPGVFAVQQSAPISRVIEDLVLLATCAEDGEWSGQILFVPLS